MAGSSITTARSIVVGAGEFGAGAVTGIEGVRCGSTRVAAPVRGEGRGGGSDIIQGFDLIG